MDCQVWLLLIKRSIVLDLDRLMLMMRQRIGREMAEWPMLSVLEIHGIYLWKHPVAMVKMSLYPLHLTTPLLVSV